MTCPKCGSDKVNVQMVSETKTKRKHSVVYWVFVGWWLNPLLWIFLTIPMIIIKIFRPKNYKTKTIHKSMSICQSCGHNWTA